MQTKAGPNQALEQTRDNVLRYGEVVGCELLNFFVIRLKFLNAERGSVRSESGARTIY